MSGIFEGGTYYPLGCAEEQSEGEYQYQQALCDAVDEDEDPSTLHQPVGVWRTRAGDLFEISEMTIVHLRNAIEVFERAGYGDRKKIKELRRELRRRAASKYKKVIFDIHDVEPEVRDGDIYVDENGHDEYGKPL